MLPEPHRLHHHSDFSRTVRRGRRIGRRDIVVHAFDRRRDDSASDTPELSFSGPRFGLIVSKSVGSAVTRHSVARRLRHVCRPAISSLDPEIDIVIRALPSAATASSHELTRQLNACLDKMRLVEGRVANTGGHS